MTAIVTGADRLMNLISEKKKVAVDSAAAVLGVSRPTVVDLANFLEQDGLIEIDDRLLHSYLVLKKEPEKPTQPSTYIGAMKDNQHIDNVEKKLKELKTDIMKKFGDLEDELKVLKKIAQHGQKISKQEFGTIEKRLNAEDRAITKLNNEITREEKEISTETKEIKELKKEETAIEKKIDDISNYTHTNQQRLQKQRDFCRDRIRVLNYEKAQAIADNRKSDIRSIEDKIEQFKKKFYHLGKSIGDAKK